MGKLVSEHWDKQIVTFTFASGLDPARVAEWNEQIRQLKARFGDRLSAETVRESERKPKTPKAKPKGKPKARPKAKPKPKPKKPSPRRRRKNK